jgi:imidazolonepropionase-like amidohydrolase
VLAPPAPARPPARRAAATGWDAIKVTLFVGPAAFDALTDEARRLGLPVVGHVDSSVGVPRALAAGQHIEHLDNYIEQVLADSAPSRVSVSDRGVYRAENWVSLDHLDERKLARIAGLTARSGTYTTPTLTIFKNAYGLGIEEQMVRSWPDWRMYPPAVRDLWLRVRARYWSNPAGEARRHKWVAARNQLVKAIADSGGRILAGSDAPEWFHSYGWTLHRELRSLVEAGLTPYQALAAATITPARFLGASAEWGTIEPGKRADLVLLSADPLADIGNTTRIEAVVVGGRWIDRAARERMIEDAMRRLSGM